MRKLIAAGLAATLMIAPVAHAQDQNVCPILRTVLEASTNHFKAIKGKKIESDTWKVTSNLAYAERCQIDNVLAPEIRYACFFSAAERGATPDMVRTMSIGYANEIARCRPDLTQAQSQFSQSTTEFSDATGVRVDVTLFDDFFTVGVYEPQN